MIEHNDRMYSALIIEAFCTADYPQVLALCTQVLNKDPDNQLAQAYLSKVQQAWVHGYGVPFELRKDFYRAQMLVKLFRYEEAKDIYERIQKVLDELGVPRWLELEEALIELEGVETLAVYLDEADRLFRADDWEEACEVYQESLKVMPDSSFAKSRLRKANSILAQVGSIKTVIETPDSLLVQNPDDLLSSLQKAQMLRIQHPSSEYLGHVLADLQEKTCKVRNKLIDAIEECLQLAGSISNLDVSLGLVRRAKSMYKNLERFPGPLDGIEDLFVRLNVCEAQIRLSREFAADIHSWLTVGESQSAQVDMLQENLSVSLSGLLKASQGMVARLGRLQWLLPELEFCIGALGCVDAQQIADFPNGFDQGTLYSEVLSLEWAAAWKEFRESLVMVTKKVSGWSQLDHPESLIAAIDALQSLRLRNTDQVFPLEQIGEVIVCQWRYILQDTLQETSNHF